MKIVHILANSEDGLELCGIITRGDPDYFIDWDNRNGEWEGYTKCEACYLLALDSTYGRS